MAETSIQMPTILAFVVVLSFLSALIGFISPWNKKVLRTLGKASTAVFVLLAIFFIGYGPAPEGSTDLFSQMWWDFVLK